MTNLLVVLAAPARLERGLAATQGQQTIQEVPRLRHLLCSVGIHEVVQQVYRNLQELLTAAVVDGGRAGVETEGVEPVLLAGQGSIAMASFAFLPLALR